MNTTEHRLRTYLLSAEKGETLETRVHTIERFVDVTIVQSVSTEELLVRR